VNSAIFNKFLDEDAITRLRTSCSEQIRLSAPVLPDGIYYSERDVLAFVNAEHTRLCPGCGKHQGEDRSPYIFLYSFCWHVDCARKAGLWPTSSTRG